ncbi:MAG: citrate/2-methylcitrate synthase, partial [Myxococcota bacterium]
MTERLVPGLAGVPCAESSVCFIDGTKGELLYRGYPIEQLAERCTYEETVHLLLFGGLPDANTLTAFRAELAERRAVPEAVVATLRTLPTDGHPMDALTVAVGALGMHAAGDTVADASARRGAAVELVARLPTIVAAWHRIRHGQEPLAPKAELSHAANFL